MFRPSAEFSLGVVIGVFLLFLDKAGKLTGLSAVVLLVAMAAFLIHAVLSFPYIVNAPTKAARIVRGLASVIVIFGTLAIFANWILPGLSVRASAPAPESTTTGVLITDTHSRVGTLSNPVPAPERQVITKTAADTADTLSQPPAPPLSIAPLDLMASLDGYTQAQSQRLSRPYVGRHIKVAGRLSNVSTHDTGTRAILTIEVGEKRSRTVFARFAEPLDGAELMADGDSVTITGVIESVDQFHLILHDSQLLSWTRQRKN